MTVTIGSFTCNLLTVQPFGYEGEARTGLTARTFQIAGLLTRAQWQSLLSEYNSWRNTRINDQDTLLSETVGTTVALTANANGVSVTSLACWFVEPPSSEQAGAYLSASVTLVDAAQALAVLLRERELAKEREIAEAQGVDCAVVAANLQRQKDETDCELTALEGGLADDFAEQELRRQKVDAEARETAYGTLASSVEDAKTAEIHVELLDKQASIAGQTTYAADLAAADLELQAIAETGKATAYAADATSVAALQGAAIDIELLEYAAKVTALTTGSRLANLKTARALDAVYEKYISEDLPSLGTVTLGSATITLIQPMDTRSDGPQVALTATGTSYITGPLVSHEVRSINGHVTSGTFANVLSWYDTTIASVPAAGTWFPVSAPTASAEPFLIAGVKSTRYTVSVEVKKII
jgi:hypothetical protein